MLWGVKLLYFEFFFLDLAEKERGSYVFLFVCFVFLIRDFKDSFTSCATFACITVV